MLGQHGKNFVKLGSLILSGCPDGGSCMLPVGGRRCQQNVTSNGERQAATRAVAGGPKHWLGELPESTAVGEVVGMEWWWGGQGRGGRNRGVSGRERVEQGRERAGSMCGQILLLSLSVTHSLPAPAPAKQVVQDQGDPLGKQSLLQGQVNKSSSNLRRS